MILMLTDRIHLLPGYSHTEWFWLAKKILNTIPDMAAIINTA